MTVENISMASRQHRGKMSAEGPVIKSFGTFKICSHNNQTKVTITTALDTEPFPNESGSEVKVEQVNPTDGSAFLRLIPANGSE